MSSLGIAAALVVPHRRSQGGECSAWASSRFWLRLTDTIREVERL